MARDVQNGNLIKTKRDTIGTNKGKQSAGTSALTASGLVHACARAMCADCDMIPDSELRHQGGTSACLTPCAD